MPLIPTPWGPTSSKWGYNPYSLTPVTHLQGHYRNKIVTWLLTVQNREVVGGGEGSLGRDKRIQAGKNLDSCLALLWICNAKIGFCL